MKHLPLTAVSVLSALALSAGVMAQDAAQPAPDTETQQAQPAGESSSSTASAGESLENWDQSQLAELGGKTLMNSQGDSLGEIQEFVRSTDDDQIYAVISNSEPLEVDTETTVKLSDLRMQDDNVVYAGDEQELERMFAEQPYEESQYQPLDQSEQQAGIEPEESAEDRA